MTVLATRPTTTPASTLAVLRQTLYALTRAVGDLSVGTLVAPLREDHDPTDRPSCYVQDGAGRGCYITPRDLERVTGLTVLADHVEGYTTAFTALSDEAHARRFATALMGASLPAVAGVWVGEVIRQH